MDKAGANREYYIEIDTPDRGTGGTDKAPVLHWFNDLGVSLRQVKYSGENVRDAFERDSTGIGGIESEYPLEDAHLQLRLSNTGGNDAPDWRAGYVRIYWGDFYEYCSEWKFDVDMEPGGPGTSRRPVDCAGAELPKLAEVFFLRELPLIAEDERDEAEIQRYLADCVSDRRHPLAT